jgi:CRP/FNR family transcriptional regulator
MNEARPCADCSVRNRALCGTLSDTELVALNRIGRRRRLAAGETLVWAGERAEMCGNVLSGALKLSAATADGREQIVGTLHPADFIGRPYADQTEFTVTALTGSEICTFPRHPFERVMEEHAALERQLLDHAFAALSEARAQMLTLARRSAREKVAGFLLDMANRSDAGASRATSDGPITFDLPLNRGQIADLLGLTIETVSRQLTKLKSAGLIALPSARGITIRDETALRAMAG